MSRICHIFCLLFLISNSLWSTNIENIGIPFIENYDRQDYQAGTQNWCVNQDADGVMWFGNTAFLIWYDGNEWGNITVPNGSIVRSLYSTNQDVLLAGAFAEFGSIERDSTGSYYFRSWVPELPENFRNFSDVWKIHELGTDIYFQSTEYVFVFREGKFLRAYQPEASFRFSFVSNNRFYIEDRGIGLKVLMQGRLLKVEDGDFFSDKEIWFLQHHEGHILAGTQKEGFFTFKNGRWNPWDSQVNDLVKDYSLYSGLKTVSGQFIFGTVQNGLLICDEQGRVINIVNRKSGLQNNTVLAMTIDREDNLWLGLDQGISYLKINSAFTRLSNEEGFGTGYASVFHNNSLYVGTNQGVYVYELNGNPYDDFHLIKGSEGQVWNLQIVNNDVYCSHHNGLFRIEGEKFIRIADVQGCWRMIKVPFQEHLYLIGTYNGLYGYSTEPGPGGNQVWKIQGFNESSRILEFDSDHDLWMSHGYKGVYKISFDPAYQKVENLLFFGESQGLPFNTNNELFKNNQKIMIATRAGFYHYNDLTGRMEPYDLWNNQLPFKSPVTKVIQDPWQRFYFFSEGKLALALFEDDSLVYFNSNAFLPLQNSFFTAFENISFISRNISVIGTENGFVLYNRNMEKQQGIELSVFFKRMVSREKNRFNMISDTLSFMNDKIKIPYGKNNLMIEISVPYYQNPSEIKINTELNDESINPSHLSPYLLEIEGLREGEYTLEVEVLDISDYNEPGHAQLEFTIMPPWYREWYAYLAYAVILLMVSLLSVYVIRKNNEKIRRKEKIRQQRKMIQQEIRLKERADRTEREMIKLKNEKLESENRMKAEEIANSTMELVHKNKMLLDVKEKLVDVQKEKEIDRRNQIIRQLLKSIDRDLNNEEKWKIFEKNFDEVHENFLNRFKEKHPNITSKDMRLCAYLRMNLSSKEIAPLLSISVRSVEISRYRLRKKLFLQHDEGLSEYILHF